jgi:DNA polymerase elongation subunit (family B)
VFKNVYVSRKEELVYVWDDQQPEPITVPFATLNYAYKKDPDGSFLSMYGESLSKIHNFNKTDSGLYEADVPLDTRSLIELYYDSDNVSSGHTIVFIDIETDSEGGYPNIETADKAITAISLYDVNTNCYHCFILDKDKLIKNENKENINVYSFDTEESLLSSFINKWCEILPTIVSGWNTEEFDMVYLYRRIKNILGKDEGSRLSPIQRCYINPHYGELICAGVCTSLDYLKLYKRYSGVKEASYQLGNIGKKEVGIDKISYDGSLNKLYKENIKKYIEYNLNDVVICVALHKKYDYISLAREICHYCHVPYELYDVSSRFLEGAVLTYLRRNNLVANNKPAGGEEEYKRRMLENEDGFSGAYVKDPVPGLYQWVYDLDAQSLYPSIIKTLNISPETLMAKISNWIPEDYLAGKATHVDLIYNDGQSKTYSIDEFKKLITDNNYSVGANGAIYSLNKTGIIPVVIDRWLDDRKKIRKLEKEYKESGDQQNYLVQNRKQTVLKVLANSIFGTLGLETWRWYNKTNAECITTSGVLLAKTVARIINQHYNSILCDNKDYVTYQDTDSAFSSALPLIEKLYPDIDKSNEKEMVNATLKITSDVQNYVNKMFDIFALKAFNVKVHKFFVKQEVVSKSAIWLAKKRYAQWVININGAFCDEIDVKGLDTVRSSFPKKLSEVFENIIEMILKGTQKHIIDEEILSFKSKLQTFSIFDIAKSTSVKFVSQKGDIDYNPKNRKPFEIIKGSPAQVKGAIYYLDLLKHWKLTKVVEPIYHGQKIRYIYLKNNEYNIDCLALKADGTDPKKILEFANMYNDPEKLYKRELETKLSEFYDILKWDMPSENAKKAEEFFSL